MQVSLRGDLQKHYFEQVELLTGNQFWWGAGFAPWHSQLASDSVSIDSGFLVVEIRRMLQRELGIATSDTGSLWAP